jgi:YHS domain-containing protein
MTVQTKSASAHQVYADNDWFFCSTACAGAFDADPVRHATPSSQNRT